MNRFGFHNTPAAKVRSHDLFFSMCFVLLPNVAKGNELCLPVNVALFSRNLQSVLLHPVIKHKLFKEISYRMYGSQGVNKANSLFNQTNCQELSVDTVARYACVAHTSVAACACKEDSFRRILCPTRKTVRDSHLKILQTCFLTLAYLSLTRPKATRHGKRPLRALSAYIWTGSMGGEVREVGT